MVARTTDTIGIEQEEVIMSQNVAVIGTGRMGSALATALFNKGFTTTVWNRTASKTEPLARLGLRVAQNILAAVNEADVVIVNINNYDSTMQLLRHPDIESALHGKILVQLTSGTPDEAREMESWARQCGIQYLDGAIWSAPMMIGTPECILLYSGSEELFERVKPVLSAFGENTRFVGQEIGQASSLDVAVLAGFVMNALFGFLQGYIICEAENLPLEKYMQLVKSTVPRLEGIVTRVYGRLQEKDYAGDQSSLEAWTVAPQMLISWGREHGVDHSIADAQLSLFEKAIEVGKGQAGFTYLYEILRKGRA
jgi:3-hydroxyisobutyrate dehydrogenase-like beta-hydroxyacid dehydrogenase